jgi:hypothetical protein
MSRTLKTTVLAVLLGLAGPAAAQEAQLLTSDTDFDMGDLEVTPKQVTVHGGGEYAEDGSLVVPGFVEIDALHRLYDPGQWLFSVKNGLSSTDANPDPLAVEIGGSIDPRDVVRYDGDGEFTFFFRGNDIAQPIPAGANVDAIHLDGQDLLLSLDAGIPTDLYISGVNVEQADLIRYERTPGGSGPADWQLVGLEFDATGHVPSSSNLIGAALDRNGHFVMSFKIDSDLTPSSSQTTYLPGELARWDGLEFQQFEALEDWPSQYFVNSLALIRADTCAPLAGADPGDENVDLCGLSWATDMGTRRARMEWRLEDGASKYNVYSGSLDDLTLPGTPLDLTCETPGGMMDTQFVIPDAGPNDQFFLVTGVFDGVEGTLGNEGDGALRTTLSPCP